MGIQQYFKVVKKKKLFSFVQNEINREKQQKITSLMRFNKERRSRYYKIGNRREENV